MSQIMVLLQLAISLLTMATTNTTITSLQKQQAIDFAVQSVQITQNYINSLNSTNMDNQTDSQTLDNSSDVSNNSDSNGGGNGLTNIGSIGIIDNTATQPIAQQNSDNSSLSAIKASIGKKSVDVQPVVDNTPSCTFTATKNFIVDNYYVDLVWTSQNMDLVKGKLYYQNGQNQGTITYSEPPNIVESNGKYLRQPSVDNYKIVFDNGVVCEAKAVITTNQ